MALPFGAAFAGGFGSLGKLLGSAAASVVGNAGYAGTSALFGGIQARRNWKYKKKEMKLQQQYNLENMQRQFDYQQEAWRRENEWNDPRNATARWRLAGISPQAVFGNSPGGAGVAGSAGTPDVSNPSAGGNVDTSSYHPTLTPVEMMRAQNEKKVTDATVNKLNAEADKLRGDTKDPDITKRSQLVQLSRDEIAKETEEVQRDILKIQKDFVEAKESNDVAIQRAKFLEIIANCNKLLADKELAEEMKEKVRADRELAEEMVNTEKSKQRSLDADANYKDAIRETENLLRSGKRKLQVREIMKVVYETFGQDLSNARQIEELARLMTATDRPSSIPAYLDKIAEQIGGSDQDAKWEVKGRLAENLRKLLKSYGDNE